MITSTRTHLRFLRSLLYHLLVSFLLLSSSFNDVIDLTILSSVPQVVFIHLYCPYCPFYPSYPSADPDQVILSIDAYDIIMLRGPEALYEKFMKMVKSFVPNIILTTI